MIKVIDVCGAGYLGNCPRRAPRPTDQAVPAWRAKVTYTNKVSEVMTPESTVTFDFVTVSLKQESDSSKQLMV